MSPPSGGNLPREKLRRRYRNVSDEKFNAAYARSISRVEKGLRDGSIKGVDICVYISLFMECETTYESIPSFEYFLSKKESLKSYGEPNTQPAINKKTLPTPDDTLDIVNAIESINVNGPIIIPKDVLAGFISGYGGGVLSSNDINYGSPKTSIGEDIIDLGGDAVFEVEKPAVVKDLISDGRCKESIQLMGEGLGLVKKWLEDSVGMDEDLVAVKEVLKVCILCVCYYLKLF